MKVIIAGCGRVGALLAKLLDEKGHQVTIIDTNAASFRQLDSSFQGIVVTGDATDEEVLRKAGVEEAQALAAVTQEDNRNIMIGQIGQQTFKVPRVICRINDSQVQDIYEGMGLEVISLSVILSQLLKEKVLG